MPAIRIASMSFLGILLGLFLRGAPDPLPPLNAPVRPLAGSGRGPHILVEKAARRLVFTATGRRSGDLRLGSVSPRWERRRSGGT